jgi:dipeptidyl aminopeptidase/acylaminoacyl peptidase
MRVNAILSALAIFLLSGCATFETVPVNDLAALPANSTSRFMFPSAGGLVEGYLARPRGNGRFPLVVLLHGHSWVGIGARRVLPAAEAFAKEVCYASIAVSLPGYGGTKVPDAPLAESTRHAVLDAVARAKQLPWIDSSKIYVYGFSRGAVVAAALANEIDGLKGTMLHSGAYDLATLYKNTSSFLLKKILNPNGEAEPKLQNLLPEAADWQASTLILHGTQDSLIPVSQANQLHDRLRSLGKQHRLVLYPEHGHWLPLRAIKDQAVQFLKDNGGSACAASNS